MYSSLVGESGSFAEYQGAFAEMYGSFVGESGSFAEY